MSTVSIEIFASIDRLCPKYVLEKIAGKEQVPFDMAEMSWKVNIQMTVYENDMEKVVTLDIQKKPVDILLFTFPLHLSVLHLSLFFQFLLSFSLY